MGVETGISWSDRTKSAWHGCTHDILEDGSTHPGCENCYAEIGSKRNPNTLGIWGPDGTRVASKSFDKDCLQWQKDAAAAKTVYAVFPSIHDPFEDRDDLIPLRLRMFEIIDRCPNLLFLLLTKRPQNIRRFWPIAQDFRYNNERLNVALGTSISNQQTAQEKTMKLITASDLTPLLFLSAGPLLGDIDLTALDNGNGETYNALTGEVSIDRGRNYIQRFQASDTKPIGWVITEGESTDKARPCNPNWVRSLRDQCRLFGTPFHHKQHGEWLPYENNDGSLWVSQRGDSIDASELPVDLVDCQPIGDWYAPQLDGIIYRKVGKAQAGAYLDGELIQEFPEFIKSVKAKGSTR